MNTVPAIVAWGTKSLRTVMLTHSASTQATTKNPITPRLMRSRKNRSATRDV